MNPDTLAGRRFCYGLLPTDMLPGADPLESITPIIIIDGERGYHRTDYLWQRAFAEEARDVQNAKLGLTPEEADKMMLASMQPEDRELSVAVYVSPVVAGLLATLAPDAAPEGTPPDIALHMQLRTVIDQLIDHAQQGVYRPGSWERNWLISAFGMDFIRRLEPGCPYGRERCEDIFQKPKP